MISTVLGGLSVAIGEWFSSFVGNVDGGYSNKGGFCVSKGGVVDSGISGGSVEVEDGGLES